MKITEFRKLIREEVRIQLKEVLDPKTLAKDILDILKKTGVYDRDDWETKDKIKLLASNEFLQDYRIKGIIANIIKTYK